MIQEFVWYLTLCLGDREIYKFLGRWRQMVWTSHQIWCFWKDYQPLKNSFLFRYRPDLVTIHMNHANIKACLDHLHVCLLSFLRLFTLTLYSKVRIVVWLCPMQLRFSNTGMETSLRAPCNVDAQCSHNAEDRSYLWWFRTYSCYDSNCCSYD